MLVLKNLDVLQQIIRFLRQQRVLQDILNIIMVLKFKEP